MMDASLTTALNDLGEPGSTVVVARGSVGMHALFVTFRSAVPLDELEEGYRQFAEALRSGAAPGFVAKTWLVDGSTIGGFYGFEDRATADGYIEQMLKPAVIDNPSCSDIRIEHFEIIDSFSAMTNGLHASMAGATA